MSEKPTLETRLEEWRKRWHRKIRADLFNNRKEDLKAMFRAKRWVASQSDKLEGRLFLVKEYHQAHGYCQRCQTNTATPPMPGTFTDYEYTLGYYSERLDKYGFQNPHGPDGGTKVVRPNQIVFATGKYIERITYSDLPGNKPERHIEILTEKAIGYIKYDFLRPIKKSEIEARNQ